MIKTVQKDLTKLLKNTAAVSSSASVANHYSKDESYHPQKNPDIDTFPSSVEDVSKIHQYCYRGHHIKSEQAPLDFWAIYRVENSLNQGKIFRAFEGF